MIQSLFYNLKKLKPNLSQDQPKILCKATILITKDKSSNKFRNKSIAHLINSINKTPKISINKNNMKILDQVGCKNRSNFNKSIKVSIMVITGNNNIMILDIREITKGKFNTINSSHMKDIIIKIITVSSIIMKKAIPNNKMIQISKITLSDLEKIKWMNKRNPNILTINPIITNLNLQ